jgi:hypothetical protein
MPEHSHQNLDDSDFLRFKVWLKLGDAIKLLGRVEKSAFTKDAESGDGGSPLDAGSVSKGPFETERFLRR